MSMEMVPDQTCHTYTRAMQLPINNAPYVSAREETWRSEEGAKMEGVVELEAIESNFSA